MALVGKACGIPLRRAVRLKRKGYRAFTALLRGRVGPS